MFTGSKGQRGASLIELVVAIVIISIALTSVLLSINRSTSVSTYPMVQSQALAVAEAYLDEILLRAFADPAGGTGCAAGVLGPDGGEARGTYDDIDDYHGTDDQPPRDQQGNAIGALGSYRVQVTVTCEALDNIAASDAARINVRVSSDALDNWFVQLDGYRADLP